MLCLWGREYSACMTCLETWTALAKDVLGMILNSIWWWGCSSWALGCEEHFFIAITPRSTLLGSHLWVECSQMVWETGVQSQVESYQWLKKWYLLVPCLTLSIIRYGSRVKWNNPGKGVTPSPTPWCSSYWKGSLQVTLDYGRQHYLPNIGMMVTVFANGPRDLDSVQGWVIPKAKKIVLDASLLNTQHYKVWIRSKVEPSRERSSTLPTPWCSSYQKGSLRVTLDYGCQLYFYFFLITENYYVEKTTQKMYIWMYVECDSPASWHIITQNGLTCHQNQSINQSWKFKK